MGWRPVALKCLEGFFWWGEQGVLLSREMMWLAGLQAPQAPTYIFVLDDRNGCSIEG